MMSAQGTWNVPAGHDFGHVPGITTECRGTRPLLTTGEDPVTSTIEVDAVSTVFAPSTAPSSTITPSTTIEREPRNAWSSITTGCACGGSSTPPMPTPPDRWTP